MLEINPKRKTNMKKKNMMITVKNQTIVMMMISITTPPIVSQIKKNYIMVTHYEN